MKENIDVLKRVYFWSFLTKDEKIRIADDGFIGKQLTGKPIDYVEIAKQSKNLEGILIDGLESQEYYDEMIKFINECPDHIEIRNVHGKYDSYAASKEEFLLGEKIIRDVISEINPEWDTFQKAAYVHYRMGSLVTYYPEAEKNGGDGINAGKQQDKDCRSIWRGLSTKNSLCAGVTAIQRCILARLGINTHELSSNTHSFMLIETEKGNIITDATHDLKNTLFKLKPNFFGVSYEELQRRDSGKSTAHKLEKEPENVITFSDDELRGIYASIGLTNEKKAYLGPLQRKLIADFKEEKFETDEDKLKWMFDVFTTEFPKETLHLSEMRMMMETYIVYLLGFPENQLKTKFVYAKDDVNCEKPEYIVHLSNDELKEKVFMLNQEKVMFEAIGLKDFDARYTIHEFDISRGQQPFWKDIISDLDKEIVTENVVAKDNLK